MKTISILVPEHAVIQAIADPQYCLSAVNQFMVDSGKQPIFNIEFVGAKREIKLNNGNFSVFPDKLLDEVIHTDLIFVPAIFGDMNKAIEANIELFPFIAEHYQNGSEVASLCLGAFLLASTGLLNGKKCSTHWGYYEQFNQLFPKVITQSGSIVTDEQRIYTSGGANSYWNLLLHLIEKYTDRETAIWVSKYFAIDISRNNQSVFAMFSGQKNHHDETVGKAQEYIEQHIEAKISVDELADKVAIGRRSFERRFKQATNNTVMEYIQRVKIEAAKRSFETSIKNINEVMFDVGYTDTKAFRNTFKKITGLTPVEYRNKYNRMAYS